MAEISNDFKACHIHLTVVEWENLKVAMDSEHFLFPPLFEHPNNDEKLLPEYILDMGELADMVQNATEHDRHLSELSKILGIESSIIKSYGFILVYYDDY